MARSIPVGVTGILVAVLPPRPYKFRDDKDGREVEGISRKAYLSCDFSEEPVLVKFPEDRALLHTQLAEDGRFGDVIEARGDARDGALVVTSFKTVQSAAA